VGQSHLNLAVDSGGISQSTDRLGSFHWSLRGNGWTLSLLPRGGHLPWRRCGLWHGISLPVMLFPSPRSRSPAELTCRAQRWVRRRPPREMVGQPRHGTIAAALGSDSSM